MRETFHVIYEKLQNDVHGSLTRFMENFILTRSCNMKPCIITIIHASCNNMKTNTGPNIRDSCVIERGDLISDHLQTNSFRMFRSIHQSSTTFIRQIALVLPPERYHIKNKHRLCNIPDSIRALMITAQRWRYFYF